MIKTFKGFVILERRTLKSIHRVGATLELENVRGDMAKVLKEIGAEGDIANILQTETIISRSDLEHFGKSKPMRNSLTKTLEQISYAENMLGMVADPVRYKHFAEGFNDSRNLKRGGRMTRRGSFFRPMGRGC